MTHVELVEIAGKWLKRQGCNVVLTERNAGGECPDAIGWYCASFSSVVVECKVSIPDFWADQDKPHRSSKAMGVMRWYLAPKGLLSVEWLPLGWGLLEWTGKVVRVVRPPMGVAHARRDIREEARLLLSELRIFHAQDLTYRKGAARWNPQPNSGGAVAGSGDSRT